jgi:hypothetical protein
MTQDILKSQAAHSVGVPRERWAFMVLGLPTNTEVLGHTAGSDYGKAL